jgi:hypothetical protein
VVPVPTSSGDLKELSHQFELGLNWYGWKSKNKRQTAEALKFSFGFGIFNEYF